MTIAPDRSALRPRVARVIAILLCATALAHALQDPHVAAAHEYPDLGELDPARLAAAELLRFDAQVEVEAPLDEVWRAWTTPAGLRSWYAPDAQVVLARAGRFGSGAGRVLGFVPGEMLCFTSPVAPSYARPHAAGTAWSVVHFDELEDGRTRVRYAGFESDLGPDFREAHWRAKIRTMSYTLRDLSARFATGPVDWEQRARGH